MEQDTAQQIEQRLAELPEDVRNAVMSVEWEQKVQAIAQKHSLHQAKAPVTADSPYREFFGRLSAPSKLAWLKLSISQKHNRVILQTLFLQGMRICAKKSCP